MKSLMCVSSVLAPHEMNRHPLIVESTHWAQQPCRSGCLAQLHTNPLQPTRRARSLQTVQVASLTYATAAYDATVQDKPTEQQRQHKRTRPAGSQQRRLGNEGRGKLLIKRQPPLGYGSVPTSLCELRGGLPRGVTTTVPAAQQQHQQHDAQQLSAPQSLRDKNMSFSGALKRLRCLDDWLALLGSSQWGSDLCDLDGVSVVGALVWLVKSREWAALQHGGTTAVAAGGHQQRQRAQQALQVVLDHAWTLVMPSQQHSSSDAARAAVAPGVSSSSGAVAAPLMRPAELASLIYCTSKLGQTRPQLLAAAAAALQQDLYACSTTELFRLVWGLASARVHPGEAWLLSYCKAAQAKFFMSSASELAVTAYGLARLGYRPPDIWISAWLEASEPMLAQFSPQNLSNAAWGLSCWRFQAPAHWLDSFYAASAAAMPEFSPIGISQLQLALVTLGGGTPPPDSWLAALLAAAQPLFGGMELLQLCNFGWGLAQWGYCPPAQVMAEYLAATEPLLAAGTPTDLSTMLWICNKLSYVPHQSWLSAWFAATAASLPRCEPQHLTTIALVLGRWGLVPAPGFSVEYWRCTKARFQDFTAYQMGLLIWGLGKANRAVPTTWATALLATFAKLQLQEAEAVEVCRLIRGLSHVVVKPRGSRDWVDTHPAVQHQLQQLCSWLQPQLPELEPQWLVVLVQGLKALGVKVAPDFLQSLTTAAAQLDERLTVQQRKMLVLALGKLR